MQRLLNFDADVKNTTARYQCENRFDRECCEKQSRADTTDEPAGVCVKAVQAQASFTLAPDGIIFVDISFTLDVDCTFAVHEVDINVTLEYETKVDVDVKNVAIDVKVVTNVKTPFT